MTKQLKKRSKAYKPKQLNSNAHFNAIVMARPLSQSVKAKFLKDVDVSILAMSRGVADINHFHKLATMVEVCAVMVKGVFHEKSYEPSIIEAKNGLYRSKLRFERSGAFGLDGPGLQALKDTISIFSDVLDNITGNDLAKAIDIINKNIQEKNFYKPEMMAA